MQIKKLNNNKLKVVLSKKDLKENDIDLNTFMANSLDSQELFLDILDIAEEKFNFYVDDSKLLIESISLANDIFIFTITKVNENISTSTSINNIYCFDSFDHLADALKLINLSINKIYTYNNRFYLILDKDNDLNYILNEFSDYKISSDYLENIFIEHGTLYKI